MSHFLTIASIIIFAVLQNSPHVFTDCFRVKQKQAWTDFDVQWAFRFNGVTYIHQMRKSKKTRGVDAQFVRYSDINQAPADQELKE